MHKKASFIIPTVIIKSSFIDGQRLANETVLGQFKPYNALHTGGAAAALGGLAGLGGSFAVDTVANQFRDKKKSNKDKFKNAILAALIGSGVGGIAGGLTGKHMNNKKTSEVFDEYEKGVGHMNDYAARVRKELPLISRLAPLDHIPIDEEADKSIISKGISDIKLNQTTENPSDQARKELFNNFRKTVRELAKDKGSMAKELADITDRVKMPDNFDIDAIGYKER